MEEKMNSLPKEKEYEKDGTPTKIQVYQDKSRGQEGFLILISKK